MSPSDGYRATRFRRVSPRRPVHSACSVTGNAPMSRSGSGALRTDWMSRAGSASSSARRLRKVSCLNWPSAPASWVTAACTPSTASRPDVSRSGSAMLNRGIRPAYVASASCSQSGCRAGQPRPVATARGAATTTGVRASDVPAAGYPPAPLASRSQAVLDGIHTSGGCALRSRTVCAGSCAVTPTRGQWVPVAACAAAVTAPAMSGDATARTTGGGQAPTPPGPWLTR